MQRSSFAHTIVIRAYCQLYYCVKSLFLLADNSRIPNSLYCLVHISLSLQLYPSWFFLCRLELPPRLPLIPELSRLQRVVTIEKTYYVWFHFMGKQWQSRFLIRSWFCITNVDLSSTANSFFISPFFRIHPSLKVVDLRFQPILLMTLIFGFFPLDLANWAICM